MTLPQDLKKFNDTGLILIPLTVKDGKKLPLIEYKGYKEKPQDLATLHGLYETYKDVNPLQWAVYCINGVVGLDFDTEADYKAFFGDIDTLTTRSPNGGYHAFIRSLTPCRAFDVLGIEVKVNVLCTISGVGYEIFRDAPIKEFDDAETFLSKKFPKIKIDKKVKDIQIKEVIGKYTEIKPTAKDHIFMAKCPIHEDSDHEHLYIYENTNSWYCFKCKKGGDAIAFIKAYKGISKNDEAFKFLCEILGIEVSEDEENKEYRSFYDFPDGKHAEEIYKDGIPVFITYDPKTEKIDYLDKIPLDEITIYPIPLDPKLRQSLTLADGVEDYGTLDNLIDEIRAFALEEFDPVSNRALLELILHVYLASWFVPRWMQNMAERFFPAITARGPSETGKKRLLTIGRWIAYRPLYALKTTKVPTLFRMVDPWQGTLILDEADLNDSNESSDFIEFYNSRADGVPIPRYSTDSKGVEFWYSFGLTLTATRKAYVDDGAESRTIVFPSESTSKPENYNLLPSKEWLEKGKQLQRKLLMFRLKHLNGEVPNNLIIPNIRGFRVRECLLSLQVLGKESKNIIDNLQQIAAVLEKRVISERASSREGMLLNIVYSALDDSAEIRPEGIHHIIVKTTISKSKDGEEKEYTTPLNASGIAKTLNDAFSASELVRIWRGLGQDTKQQLKIEQRKYRGVLLITDAKRLDREFKKYVPDAKDQLTECYEEKDNFRKYEKPKPDEKPLDCKPSSPVPLVPLVPPEQVFAPIAKNENIYKLPPNTPETTHTYLGGTSGTSGTTQIKSIELSLKDWEDRVNCKPFEKTDMHKFLSWFSLHVDSNIPSSQVWGVVEKLKKLNPETTEKVRINIAGVDISVEEGL